jgi:mono/diheme cytochrome c family protein
VHHPTHPSRHLARLLCLTLAGFLAGACGERAPEYTPQQVEAGSKAFQSTCATCHGRDANGLPKLGKGLLMNPFVIEKSDEELIAFLKTGRRAGDPLNTTGVDMPPKGGNPALTDQDLASIVAYLRTLQ